MSAGKVAAIFDVGKTNKKLLVFDQEYQLINETSVQLPETTDEEGFPCEDVHALTDWVITNFENLSLSPDYQVGALNFSSYGASFVHLDNTGEPCCPLYNYLKPFPDQLRDEFYSRHGGEEKFSMETASPVLGSLNSGMQLYRLKKEQPALFARIRSSLHLPQYLNYILTGKTSTDITSVGCHTNLWNFSQNGYHDWVYQEKIDAKFAPVVPGNAIVNDPKSQRQPPIGVGLHDSSAALIPYLENFREPFILISTGTWCISMNPFNNDPLSREELLSDCLCYLTYKGEPVKSARLFAGDEHDKQAKRIASFFNRSESSTNKIRFDVDIYKSLVAEEIVQINNNNGNSSMHVTGKSVFNQRELSSFANYETAYHQLIADIMAQQVASTSLVINSQDIRHLFVDGGFSKNEIYMNLLARAFPDFIVAAASVPQSTGLGAALAIHKHWNNNPVPKKLIQLKKYPADQ